LDALLPKLIRPESRVNMLLTLGNACINCSLGDRAGLEYLTAAVDIGIPSASVRGNTLVQIGVLAERQEISPSP